MQKDAHEVSNKNYSENMESLEDSYGGDYLRWKSWGNAEFGKLNKTEAAYYRAEISRTNYKFPKDSKILEIGFGNGAFLKYALYKNWDVSGTEINEALVKTALDHGCRAIHTDNLSSFQDNSFDLVVAFDVLEHIPQDALPLMILEIKRILSDDGFFIARFPNGDSPFGLINQNGDITHITTIGSGKVNYFAAKTNMKIIFVGGEAQPLLGISLLYFLHRMISLPVKKLINLFTKFIFFPRSNVAFCSSNLTMIYRKIKPTQQRL